jgi:hypothetical protein
MIGINKCCFSGCKCDDSTLLRLISVKNKSGLDIGTVYACDLHDSKIRKMVIGLGNRIEELADNLTVSHLESDQVNFN